jgi:cobalt-zinc-cadmium efflux system outer membrane protein
MESLRDSADRPAAVFKVKNRYVPSPSGGGHASAHDCGARPGRIARGIGRIVAGALFAVPFSVSLSNAQAAPRTASAGDSITVSLADARKLALARNPEYLAERQDIAIANGGIRQARTLRFNPDFSVVAPGVGLNGNRNAAEFTLMQEIEVAGQRGARISAARLAGERTMSTVADRSRLLLSDVSVAYYRAAAAQKRLQVASDLYKLNEQLVTAVRVQLREGEISMLESNLAEIEFGRARARQFAAQREASTATLELGRIMGAEPTSVMRILPDSALPTNTLAALMRDSVPNGVASAVIDSLTTVALQQRPDLAATNFGVREAESLVKLTRREALPNLRVGILAERNPPETFARYGPAFGFSLPILNRSQGVLAQRRAQVQQASLLRDAAQLRVRTDIETAVRALAAANAEYRVFEESVRQPARANSALLDTAFRAGKIALPTLLLLRNQLLDAELGYWQAWLARQEALTLLDTAIGALYTRERDSAESSQK